MATTTSPALALAADTHAAGPDLASPSLEAGVGESNKEKDREDGRDGKENG